MFGGNSNWRGPVWMPVNALIVRALVNLYGFYGDEFKVQCPTGSGQYMTLFGVAPLLDLFGRVDAKALLESERGSVMARVIREQVGGQVSRGK